MSDPASIPFTVNGSPKSALPGGTILTLLESLGLAEVPVLVEHNKTALFPREFPSTPLAAGDEIEIIRIVAGG